MYPRSKVCRNIIVVLSVLSCACATIQESSTTHKKLLQDEILPPRETSNVDFMSCKASPRTMTCRLVEIVSCTPVQIKKFNQVKHTKRALTPTGARLSILSTATGIALTGLGAWMLAFNQDIAENILDNPDGTTPVIIAGASSTAIGIPLIIGPIIDMFKAKDSVEDLGIKAEIVEGETTECRRHPPKPTSVLLTVNGKTYEEKTNLDGVVRFTFDEVPWPPPENGRWANLKILDKTTSRALASDPKIFYPSVVKSLSIESLEEFKRAFPDSPEWLQLKPRYDRLIAQQNAKLRAEKFRAAAINASHHLKIKADKNGLCVGCGFSLISVLQTDKETLRSLGDGIKEQYLVTKIQRRLSKLKKANSVYEAKQLLQQINKLRLSTASVETLAALLLQTSQILDTFAQIRINTPLTMQLTFKVGHLNRALQIAVIKRYFSTIGEELDYVGRKLIITKYLTPDSLISRSDHTSIKETQIYSVIDQSIQITQEIADFFRKDFSQPAISTTTSTTTTARPSHKPITPERLINAQNYFAAKLLHIEVRVKIVDTIDKINRQNATEIRRSSLRLSQSALMTNNWKVVEKEVLGKGFELNRAERKMRRYADSFRIR